MHTLLQINYNIYNKLCTCIHTCTTCTTCIYTCTYIVHVLHVIIIITIHNYMYNERRRDGTLAYVAK